ncbi:arad-like aldolase/epimerase [Marasmius fiardii PR-910]|nr:arad-like aldolase/epimerase [Marasmius fiardii PR-910]
MIASFLLILASPVLVTAAPSPNVTQVSVDLLDANHILHLLEVVDAYGHISVRNPDNASQFIMSFAVAPASATSQSLVTYDISNATPLHLTFNESVVGNDIPPSFIERFIHSQIYASQPNVSSVIHSHTVEVLPFAAVGIGLRAQIGSAGAVGALTNGTPIFDFSSVVPDDSNQLHDLLIRNSALGDSLSSTFEDGSDIVLMKGHGMAVRATSIREVTFRAFYTRRSAIVQTQAILLGGSSALPGLTEIQAADARTTNEAQGTRDRGWDLWVRQVDQNSLYTNDLRG